VCVANYNVTLAAPLCVFYVCRELNSDVVDAVIMWYQVDTYPSLELGNNCWRAGRLGFGLAAVWTTTVRLLATSPRPVCCGQHSIPGSKAERDVGRQGQGLRGASLLSPERDTKMLLSAWVTNGNVLVVRPDSSAPRFLHISATLVGGVKNSGRPTPGTVFLSRDLS